MSSFEEYLEAVKEYRTNEGYNFTDEVLEKHIKYFKKCYKDKLSIFKSMEFFYFEL